MLDIQKQLEHGTACFALEGRLDTVTSPALQAAIQEVIDGSKELVLDFGRLEYVSSAGLRVLLSAQKAMLRQGGKMKVTRVNETVMEIFEVTGFTGILTIEQEGGNEE